MGRLRCRPDEPGFMLIVELGGPYQSGYARPGSLELGHAVTDDTAPPRLGKFNGFEPPQTLVLRTLQQSELAATRLRGSFVSGTPVSLDRNDGYLLCLQR